MAKDKDRDRERTARGAEKSETRFAAAAGEGVTGECVVGRSARADGASYYSSARHRQSRRNEGRDDRRPGARRDEGARAPDMDDIARGYGVERGGFYGSRSAYTGGGETDWRFRNRAEVVSPYFGDNLGSGVDDSGRGSDLGPGIGANRAFGYGAIPSYGQADDMRGPTAGTGHGSARPPADRPPARNQAGTERPRVEREQSFERGSLYGTVNLPQDVGRTAPERGDRPVRASRWHREPLTAHDIMTSDVKSVRAEASIGDAAKIMRDENAGVVPVVNDDGTLRGIVTDRDIVMRSIAEGKDPMQLTVGELMTTDVDAATPDETVVDVIRLMGDRQIRRVPVVDRDDHLVGIISIADIATRADYDTDLQDALEEISLRRSFWTGLV